MTLSVAWRFQNRISVASDSRISNLENGYADIGVKILECPVQVISAIDHATGNFEVIHKSTVGIGIAGSFMTAYLVKEQIADVLQHLQFVGGRESLSFSKLAEAAFKIYRHGIDTLRRQQQFGIDSDMFIIGRCPATGEVAAAKFFVDGNDGVVRHLPILENRRDFTFDALGAGEERLRERIHARLAAGPCVVDYMVLEELRAMIVRGEVASVGGAIQYGKIEERDFEIYGVVDHRWDGGRPYPMPSVRGIDAGNILRPMDIDDLYLSEKLIKPFQSILEREISGRR